MRYVKTFESLKEDKEELEQLRETIKMIFVDLIDEGFSTQILTSQREKVEGLEYSARQVKADKYSKCNVAYVRLVRFKDEDDETSFRVHNNRSEIYRHKITDCFHTLLSILDRKWGGAKLEKIVREDAITSDDTYFHNIDEEKIWSRDFISVAITIVKKDL
jgi:hypothetical protein